MKRRMRERINLKKVTAYAVIVNSLQIAAALTALVYALALGSFRPGAEVYALAVTGFIVTWGAAIDIREAFAARRAQEESDMLEDALGQLETLNLTLRKQRHDFMNHLQVVFGLIELDQKDEARAYVERIYGDIQKVGRSMKTALPAVNALLAAKLADCERRGVAANFEIASDWSDMPVPAWEMCRVLGNLIDNALDALEEVGEPSLRVYMGESVTAYLFSVADNGAGMPQGVVERVFQAGFTTKRTGHGMGLSIVKDILSENGGGVRVETEPGRTVFSGEVPKASAR